MSPAPQKKSDALSTKEASSSIVSTSLSSELKEDTSVQLQANLMAIAEEEEEVCMNICNML